jgi:FlaA1/EpsC-like NDP-sugar epimerase
MYAMKQYLFNVILLVLGLPRTAKHLVVLLVDLALCILALWLAYFLRLGEFVALSGNALWAVGASISIVLPIFVVSGLYRAIFRYSGWSALLVLARAIGIYGLLYASVFTIIGVPEVPRTVGIIQPILLLLLVGGSRALAREWLGDQYRNILKREARSKVLIYGAGITGRQLAAAMVNSHEMQVVGFLDDDDQLNGRVLNGLTIYNLKDLDSLVSTRKISHVLLAMPSLSRKRRNQILSQIQSAHVTVRTLPRVTDLAQGRISISDLRDLDIDDLLGRESVIPNHIMLANSIKGKVVMITGAGGSIGSELCRQILALNPAKLLLIEQNEFALYRIHHELQKRLAMLDGIKPPFLVPLLASVQDYNRMCEIISAWHPDTLYHAAAYKHVPLVEQNLSSGIKNNVLGTFCIAKAAKENGVKDFVLISTDKAVRPTNVMGASKRLAEMMLQALAATEIDRGDIKFSMVRFGNVLGSSGSVVPKFREQIREGGPITLTHPEVTRYFMTTSEAAQLVIQAGSMAKGGDVFVLDMGQPVKIIDLARRMIELSGLTIKDEQNPDGDIEIEITGLRPGEKLYEELLIGDNPKPTSHSRIMRAQEDFVPWVEFEVQLRSLERALNMNDVDVIRLIMKKLVTGYMPSDEIVDFIYLESIGKAQTSGMVD